MPTIENIREKLANKSITLGWDAVVAYSRPKINQILEEQYVQKAASGQHFDPLSFEVTIENKLRYRMTGLTLGTPLISFENTDIESSKAQVQMPFIAGTILNLDDDQLVTQCRQMTPLNGHVLKTIVALESVKGEVQDQEVRIVF